MMGFPKIGNSGLGTKSVKGRSLVPNPAPSTNAVRIRGAMNGLQRREGVRGVQEVQEEEPGARIQESGGHTLGPPRSRAAISKRFSAVGIVHRSNCHYSCSACPPPEPGNYQH